MKSQKSQKINQLTTSVTIRLSKKERSNLDKRVKNSGLELSAYVRDVLKHPGKFADLGISLKCASLCQDILNHVEEKYKNVDDETLSEMVRELWKILKSV